MSPVEKERVKARRFGFFSLAWWALVGLSFEAAHAFKLSAYLDRPLSRELLTWAHAHGVGLSLVVLAYAATGIVDERSERYGKGLRAAALLMPLGFVLAVLGHGESDPGPAVWMVPVGAIVLIWSVLSIARSIPKAQ